MNRYFPSACEANNWKEVQTFIVSPVNVGNLERQQLSNYGVDYRCYVDAVVRVLALYSVYTLISTLQNLFVKNRFFKICPLCVTLPSALCQRARVLFAL